MQDVVISIRHEFAESIYSGLKIYELRKQEPHIEVGTCCWIYEPLPVGKVTGYFIYNGFLKMSKTLLWHRYGHRFGIDIDRYNAYYEGYQQSIAWRVSMPKSIEPRPLSDFGIKRAPQSYQKIEKNTTKTMGFALENPRNYDKTRI